MASMAILDVKLLLEITNNCFLQINWFEHLIALFSQIQTPWLCSSPCEYSLIKCINCHTIGKNLHSNNTFLQSKQTHGATNVLLLHEVSITCIHKVHNLEQQKVPHQVTMTKFLVIIDQVSYKVVTHDSFLTHNIGPMTWLITLVHPNCIIIQKIVFS